MMRRKQRRQMQWFGGDSEENYHRRGNKEVAPDSVCYNFNEYGYRSDEFDLSGASPALMFIGCSHTVGAGVPWDAVWTTVVTRHFEQTWGQSLRQYNLAASGSSTDYVAMIVHQTVELLKPKAVFVLWPRFERMTWFDKHINHFVPKVPLWEFLDEHKAFLRLFTDAHSFANFIRNYNFVANKLIIEGIPFVCCISEPFTEEALRPFLPISALAGTFGRHDIARDGFHYGIKSHAILATQMIKKAREMGLGHRLD